MIKEIDMTKKVKKFVLFFVLAFISSLIASKKAEAMKICLVPKNSNGKLVYQGSVIDMDANSISHDCY